LKDGEAVLQLARIIHESSTLAVCGRVAAALFGGAGDAVIGV
jgi:hypothetical protein